MLEIKFRQKGLRLQDISSNYACIEYEKGQQIDLTAYHQGQVIICKINFSNCPELTSINEVFGYTVNEKTLSNITIADLINTADSLTHKSGGDVLKVKSTFGKVTIELTSTTHKTTSKTYEAIYFYTENPLERKVLCALADGYKQAEIANSLGIAQSTVSNINRKYCDYLEEKAQKMLFDAQKAIKSIRKKEGGESDDESDSK